MVISLLAAIIFSILPPKTVYAHFAVEDAQTGVKAIFHVTPNHSPVAGKKSVISFDFSKTGQQTKGYSYALSVKPTKGEAVAVPVDIVGNVVIADYVFPQQGFYDIRLTASHEADGVISKLQYGQRVSRGGISEEAKSLSTTEIVAIAVAVVVAVGAVAFNLVSSSRKRKGKKK